MRKYLHNLGFRFRLHRSDLPGKPDIVLAKWGVVVEVHGCFWHQHPRCRFAYMPSSNKDFWRTKLQENVARDHRNQAALSELGWRPLVVWECEVGDPFTLRKLARDIRRGSK